MELSIDSLFDILTNPKRTGKNIRCKCPMCGKEEFYVGVEGPHFFRCWRSNKCGITGNIYSLLKAINRTDLLTKEGSMSLYSSSELVHKNLLDGKLTFKYLHDPYPLPIGYRRLDFHPYLEKRKFYEYDQYEVGYSVIDPKTRNDYVTFPIYREGITTGYISRCTLSTQEQELKKIPRYSNSMNDLSDFLYGEDDIIPNKTHTAILVEGIFDKINVDRILELNKQDSIKCVSTNGSSVSFSQSLLLKERGVKNVILLHEFDVLKKVKHSSVYLDSMFDTKIGVVEGNDPGDMEDIELLHVLDNLKNPFEIVYNYLEHKKLS